MKAMNIFAELFLDKNLYATQFSRERGQNNNYQPRVEYY